MGLQVQHEKFHVEIYGECVNVQQVVLLSEFTKYDI